MLINTAKEIASQYESIYRPREVLNVIPDPTLRKNNPGFNLAMTPAFSRLLSSLSQEKTLPLSPRISFPFIIKTIFLSLSVYHKHTHTQKLDKCQSLRAEEHISAGQSTFRASDDDLNRSTTQMSLCIGLDFRLLFIDFTLKGAKST